ncbi:MAG: TrmO family methyltransferase [Raoultibacter sp.]
MSDIVINPIGTVSQNEDGSATIHLESHYRSGMKGLNGFSHLVITWWADKADDPAYRDFLDVGMPYKNVTEPLGIFATRSPMRPNPLCVSVIAVAALDGEKGTIASYYLDAEDGTPVLDIKPYTPSIDRVAVPEVPAWCAHWPQDVETSDDFDWESEFRF